MTTEEKNKTIIRQWYTEMLNQGNLSLADEIFASDYVDQEMPPGMEKRGPESMRQLITMFHNAFPDICFELQEMIAEGETVAVRATFSGTHQGNWVGMAPTGRRIQQKQMHFYYFRDGKMVGHMAVRDDLGMRQQMGVIPAPENRS